MLPLPLCPRVEPLLPCGEDMLLLDGLELDEDGEDDPEPDVELPLSAAKAGTESASMRAEAARAPEILGIVYISTDDIALRPSASGPNVNPRAACR
jgi:hypothetical protein